MTCANLTELYPLTIAAAVTAGAAAAPFNLQLDMDAMSDYQTEMLLKLLQLREQFSSAYDSEGEALQLQLLLPSGASRRPRFTDTDAG
jgi:hypothetical protein